VILSEPFDRPCVEYVNQNSLLVDSMHDNMLVEGICTSYTT